MRRRAIGTQQQTPVAALDAILLRHSFPFSVNPAAVTVLPNPEAFYNTIIVCHAL